MGRISGVQAPHFREPDRHSPGRGSSHVGDGRVKGDGGSVLAFIGTTGAVSCQLDPRETQSGLAGRGVTLE
jgi:hypothetical protein